MASKTKLATFIIVVFLFGCDCLQNVKGNIVDSDTERPIEGVRVYKETKGDRRTIQSDSSGFFRYQSVSGGLFKCPDVKLVFSREGYEKFEAVFPSSNQNKIEVKMTKI